MCELCQIVPCPAVKSMSFYDNAQVKQIEFYRREMIDDITPQSLDAISTEIDARWQTIMEWIGEKKLKSTRD